MLSFHHKCFEEFFPVLSAKNEGSKGTKEDGGRGDAADSSNSTVGGLLVIGRGLGDWRVIVQMFRLCCSPPISGSSSRQKAAASSSAISSSTSRPLVLVVNGTSEYPNWKHLCEWWGQIPAEYSPKVLDATTLSNKRQAMYTDGGCFFVTTRVLVADLLNGIFKENLAGVIVLKAHTVTESSNEAFVIRMVKQKNSKAFVYAFTDSPEKLSSGFARLATVMKSLGVRKLFLYPRFRQEVRDDLDSASPALAEIAQPLSIPMQEIQSATVEAIKMCVEEIRRSASVDVSELTVETALFRPFDVILRQKLLSDWATVSLKTRQLIDDLQTLRHVLRDLLLLDCVSFYEKLLDVKRKSAESAQPSMWLLTDAGDRLYRHAKSRVYVIEHNRSLKVVLEPHLKIEALAEVLKEIEEKHKTDSPVHLELLGGSDVVCLVKDEQTLAQVANFLSSRKSKSLPLLQRRFLNFLVKQVGHVQAATLEQTLLQQEMNRLQQLKSELPPPKQPVKMGDTQFHPKHCLYANEDDSQNENEVEFLSRTSHVAIHLLSELATTGLLEALRPRFVILFDPDTAAMREVECYFATSKHLFPTSQVTPVHLYLLYFENSVEEQRHLSSLNQERDAFVRVIQEKSELVFAPDDSPIAKGEIGDGEELALTYDASTGQMVPVSKKHRRGVGLMNVQNKVIVDVRELRSNLPNMLHSSGFALDARTLEVGDYILSPDVCVERKAIPDLIDSLRTGRLFKQCTMMTRHYKRPCLLIEFPDAGPFRLQGDVGAEVTQVTLMSRIALLTLHFPDLRVIWSKSGRATVDIFRELQKNQLPPDGDTAEAIEATSSGKLVSDVPNLEAFELLKQLPGITKDNVYRVARTAGSLANLAKMDLESILQLCEGNETNATMLYEFLQREE